VPHGGRCIARERPRGEEFAQVSGELGRKKEQKKITLNSDRAKNGGQGKMEKEDSLFQQERRVALVAEVCISAKPRPEKKPSGY